MPFDNAPESERKHIFLDPYNKNKTFQYSLYEDGFLLWSIGPDKEDQFRNVLASESLEFHEITNCIYDPTNGTLSKGDIVFSNIFLSDLQDMTIISYKEYSDDINEREDEALEGYDGGCYYDESVDYEEETYFIGDAADKDKPDVEYYIGD